MHILTPELARRMLNVWDRRQRDPRGTLYNQSLLQAALSGKPDFALIPNWVKGHATKAGFPETGR